jgi:hypothetical protein
MSHSQPVVSSAHIWWSRIMKLFLMQFFPAIERSEMLNNTNVNSKFRSAVLKQTFQIKLSKAASLLYIRSFHTLKSPRWYWTGGRGLGLAFLCTPSESVIISVFVRGFPPVPIKEHISSKVSWKVSGWVSEKLLTQLQDLYAVHNEVQVHNPVSPGYTQPTVHINLVRCITKWRNAKFKH